LSKVISTRFLQMFISLYHIAIYQRVAFSNFTFLQSIRKSHEVLLVIIRKKKGKQIIHYVLFECVR